MPTELSRILRILGKLLILLLHAGVRVEVSFFALPRDDCEYTMFISGRGIAHVSNHRNPGSISVKIMWDFVMANVTLGWDFSKQIGFPCQFSFHQMFHSHLSIGAGTIDPIVAAYQVDLVPLHLTN
jgi:hypothetical protein